MRNRKINETLGELMTGILVSGGIIQIIDIMVCLFYPQLRKECLPFSLGLWIGIGSALFLAAHMYRSIDRALDMIPGDAEKYMRKAYMIRTLSILVIAGVVHFLNIGYVMAAFLGMLCLKFGAFLQPFMHKIWKKFQK